MPSQRRVDAPGGVRAAARTPIICDAFSVENGGFDFSGVLRRWVRVGPSFGSPRDGGIVRVGRAVGNGGDGRGVPRLVPWSMERTSFGRRLHGGGLVPVQRVDHRFRRFNRSRPSGWGFVQQVGDRCRVGCRQPLAELLGAVGELRECGPSVVRVAPPERHDALRLCAAEQAAPPPVVVELAVEPVTRGAGEHFGWIVEAHGLGAFRNELVCRAACFAGVFLQLPRELVGRTEESANVAQPFAVDPGMHAADAEQRVRWQTGYVGQRGGLAQGRFQQRQVSIPGP